MPKFLQNIEQLAAHIYVKCICVIFQFTKQFHFEENKYLAFSVCLSSPSGTYGNHPTDDVI